MTKTWRAFAAAALISLGLLFRFWNLAAQILGDDEIHTVRAALRRPVSEILVTYQLVDYCIPLTALFRSCMDAGLRLSEMTFRLPALLAGALLLLVVPGWTARRIGWEPAMVLTGLLAISPGLVFYSRIARPYALVVLLGFGAVAAFDAWWRRPSWRWGITYASLAAIAAWFHLGAATMVVSPFLFAGTASLARRDRRRFFAVTALAAATALGFLAFLVPARESLQKLVLDKSGRAVVSPAAALDVLQLLAGSGRPAVALLAWTAAAVGFVRLLRLDRDLALLTASVVFGHLAGLLILAPTGLGAALIFHRYLLAALPWVLLWMAVALGHPWPAGRRAQPAAAVLLLALLLGTGPLLSARLLHSSFAQHNDYLRFHASPPALRRQQIPRFYRRLAWSPEAGPVVEYPWIPVWRVNRSFYLYQEIHGQEVVVATVRPLLADRRLAFRNVVPGTPEGFLASRARYLVIHRHLGMEEERLAEAGSYPQPQVLGRFERLFHNAGGSMIVLLRRKWGPPDYSDRWIVVWDLERVRRSRRSLRQK